MEEYALEYLNTIKERHSKMENYNYVKLILQNYMKNKSNPKEAAQELPISRPTMGAMRLAPSVTKSLILRFTPLNAQWLLKRLMLSEITVTYLVIMYQKKFRLQL